MNTVLTKEGNSFTIKIVGRFTTDEAPGFLKAIEPATSEKGAALVVDAAELEFISSAGIRCFIMLLKSCEANGSSLTLRSLTPQIKDIFSLTALIDKFNIE